MSGDSSSDEDWRSSTIRQGYNAHFQAKCWECGKKMRNLTSLMLHYKSHNIKATCYICRVTFRRLTSLSTHLDNAHSPPLCKKCHQCFINVWELNKHAQTNCVDPVSFQEGSSSIPLAMSKRQSSNNVSNQVTVQQSTDFALLEQRVEMKPDERPETFENSVEYIVGEDGDTDSDCQGADDSTSSESDVDNKTSTKSTGSYRVDPESGGRSNPSSTDCSSLTSNNLQAKTNPEPLPNNSMCAGCGRGPFRSIKLHLLHCCGVKVKYRCFLCKKGFETEESLKEHHMSLYSCDVCGQVFSNETLLYYHPCPKGSKSRLVLFCSDAMPKVCNICRSFFNSEKSLLNHVTRVHMSVVSTKVGIIINPSLLTDKKVTPSGHNTAVQSATSGPNVVNQTVNGKLHVGQTCAGSLSTFIKFSSSSSHQGPPPVLISITSAAAPVKSGNCDSLGQPTIQPSKQLSPPLSVPHSDTDTTPATVASDPESPPSPTVLAMFENDSHKVALMKRMNTNWRSKTTYPCRQCGAMLRQPSLIISHRYLHRGHRSHQCQCGRAFKHRLHLLRHCVQHAEAVSYICASCGNSFTGTKLLAQHLKDKSLNKSHSGHSWKSKAKRKCRMPFVCYCGQLFFRPSAYIWHQLKNKTKS